MEQEEGVEYVQSLTAKELKKLARPEFEANPDKFYPTATLRNLGFTRAQCPKCNHFYWRHSESRTNCGDSQCEGKYTFIGRGSGIGRTQEDGTPGVKLTLAQAWEGFAKSLSSARIPCTPIKRYPVVARWRADVDFVAAGIFCFQPYCVTGELEPPANPLICPQFCLRFNDLDNIGLTGRHYSGFIMLGIQVFNKPDDYKFWNAECVEFNYRWLTEELRIDPDEITFIEDVWAGGGNLGPSIEYFVGGLELGNMVFMQFKTFPDGRREPLAVQVIDVGIGLERVPWLINGSPTSYMDVFPTALEFFIKTTGVDMGTEIWERYGPLSCLLNVDEVKDVDETWGEIAAQIGLEPEVVKAAIDPIRDAYVVLDHTRTIMMAIEDGSLPSNVGGASNVRNILRRVFAIMAKRGWWDQFGMDGFLHLFSCHKLDLGKIYGEFPDYPSFRDIMELEFERWQTTDAAQASKLAKLLKKRKGLLTLDDWIVCVTSHGVPADAVAKSTGCPIPGNLWYEIAERQERCVKAEAAVLYSTVHLPPTDSLFYHDETRNDLEFKANVVAVFPNVVRGGEPSVVILDRSLFYPTSGGQEHDTGVLVVNSVEHRVVDVLKVGPCVLHIIEPPLPETEDLAVWNGVEVSGAVDQERRFQLRNNHTATHIVYASCRAVLGPHVWQHGAKKTIKNAHLDITHFRSLSDEDEAAIEREANRIVQRCRDINKGYMPKDEAEQKYGFHLYQGGVVPGNELRVVNIEGTDTEACCGTHCDNTAEVGVIKLLKTQRISDGIVRLYFVAGERALDALSEEHSILNSLIREWGVTQAEIPETAGRFFSGYKKLSTLAVKQSLEILGLTTRLFLAGAQEKGLILSSAANVSSCISNLPIHGEALKASGKSLAVVGSTWLYILGVPKAVDADALQAKLFEVCSEENERKEKGAAAAAAESAPANKKKKTMYGQLRTKNQVAYKDNKKKKVKVNNVTECVCVSFPEAAQGAIVDYLTGLGFLQTEE